jgi:hypothetical protein
MAVDRISSNYSMNQHNVTSLKGQHIDPAMKLTADNSTMVVVSAITIIGSTLAVATVTNFAAALWFAMPLSSLCLLCIGIESRIDDLEYFSKRTVQDITNPPKQEFPPTPNTGNSNVTKVV